MKTTLTVLLALILSVSCTPAPPQFKNVDISGAPYARDFSLIDHHGKLRNLKDFSGKVVLVFFGYTQCPDVCPTTMSEMAALMQALGKEANRVQVLFITLDPERDTQQLLSQYVPQFDARFLGLYGDVVTTQKTAQEFKVFYAKSPGKTATSYTIDHTAGTYAFDTKGRVRLFIRYGQDVTSLAHDVKILLNEK